MRSRAERILSDFTGNPAKLKHDTALTNSGYPVFRGAFTFSHSGFKGFLRIGHIREDADPEFAALAHLTVDGNTGRFNLAGRDVGAFKSLQALKKAKQ